ncbi:MAG: twin-arginine translocase subunit TatC [Candidatus Hydrothermarchaeaceae archaeon]
MPELNWAGLLHALKKKLVYIVLFTVLAFSLFWFLSDLIIQQIKVDMLPASVTLIETSLLEYVMVKLQISLMLSVFAALPLVVLIVLRTLKIKLRKKSIVKWLFAGFVLFALGFSFTYFLLLPGAIKILTSLAIEADIVPLFSISQFMVFIVLTLVIFSSVFELPLAVSWLALRGIVSVETLRKKRRHVWVATLVFTAIVTADPTPFSQILLSIPLLILYEVSIISASLFRKS